MSGISSVFSIAGNGLTNASNQMTRTAGKIVNDTTQAAAAGGIDTTDLTQNVVDLISEKTAIQADALVLKTGQQITGTLLDMLDTDRKQG